MNKIKYFMLAMMAFVASASFTACSSDDDNNKNRTVVSSLTTKNIRRL